MKKISYAICSHNEGYSLHQLLTALTRAVADQDKTCGIEIVIVDDNSTLESTVSILENFSKEYDYITIYKRSLANDFATQKNFLNSKCSGDWILNLDADEFVTAEFLELLPQLIDLNPKAEVFRIPRIDTVEGLTSHHASMWGWAVSMNDKLIHTKGIVKSSDEYEFLKRIGAIFNERTTDKLDTVDISYKIPLVMWPDFQKRLYKNIPSIQWERPVHEYLTGYKVIATFPDKVEYAIQHHKNILRQEQQNQMYSNIIRGI